MDIVIALMPHVEALSTVLAAIDDLLDTLGDADQAIEHGDTQ